MAKSKAAIFRQRFIGLANSSQEAKKKSGFAGVLPRVHQIYESQWNKPPPHQ